MANGDATTAIEQLKQDIDALLRDEKIDPALKSVLRVQRAYIPFIVQQVQDHEELDCLDTLKTRVDEVERKANNWNIINSFGFVVAGLLGFFFGPSK